MSFAKYEFTVNVDRRQNADPNNDYLPVQISIWPKFFFSEYLILCPHFVDNSGNNYALGATDTFYAAGDTNFNSDSQDGALSGAITAGAISTVTITGLTVNTPSNTGKITLDNGADDAETLVYSGVVDNTGGSYTFSIPYNQELSYNYSDSDDATQANSVMFYSGNDQVDLAGDWSDINRSEGKISIRINMNDLLFRARLQDEGTDGKVDILFEIAQFPGGLGNKTILVQDSGVANSLVYDTDQSVTTTQSANFLTQTAGDARYLKILDNNDLTLTDDAATDLELGAAASYYGWIVAYMIISGTTRRLGKFTVYHDGTTAYIDDTYIGNDFDDITITVDYNSGTPKIVFTVASHGSNPTLTYKILDTFEV